MKTMNTTQLKQIVLATVLVATTTALAGASSTSITLDANSSLKKQGWEEVGGIAPTIKETGGKKILVFDDQSSSDSSGCFFTIPEALVKKALERGFALTFTLRWEGKPVAHTIEVLLGENRIFLALNNTPKEQNVVVLGYSENIGGKVDRPNKFHTWKLVSLPNGKIELYADGKKTADAFSTTRDSRGSKTGRLGIGGIHGTSKARTGRLELKSASFELLDK
jgi:hypothetical protein